MFLAAQLIRALFLVTSLHMRTQSCGSKILLFTEVTYKLYKEESNVRESLAKIGYICIGDCQEH